MVDLIETQFPDVEHLRDEDDAGLVHLEMACFSRYAQDRIDAGDRETVKTIFELARRLLLDGDPAVQNAVTVSFVEHLNFKNGKRQRSWAFELLPPALAEEWRALEAFWQKVERR